MKLCIVSFLLLSLQACQFYRTDNCEITFLKPYYLDRKRAVSEDELKILARAKQLLDDKSKWNTQGNRLCFYKNKWSLFCSLAQASVEISGEYKHRRVAIQETRFTINELFPERWKKHQLMDFNNNQATTYAEVIQVLNVTEERLKQRYRHSANRKENL